jgi:hypothetical protein
MSCLDNTSVGNGHVTSSSTHADALLYFLCSVSFISTSVVSVEYSIGLCLVMGCYVPHVAAVTQIDQFGCIKWLNH